MPNLANFRQLLSTSGYLAFYLYFGNGNKNLFQWEARHANLAGDLRHLVGLFLLQHALPAKQVRNLLGDETATELIAAGILLEKDGAIRTDDLVLICFNSILIFCEMGKDPKVYFGNDSIALGIYQTPILGGKALDLCAGSAIQSMIAAHTCGAATAVEINPKAAKTAAFNIRFNQLEDKVRIVHSSLEDFAEADDEKYDLITFNPPLLPVPEPLYYAFVGDGGEDGLDVTRRILHAYLPKLTETGTLEFIGCGLGKDGHPVFADSLAPIFAEYGMNVNVHLVGIGKLERGDGGFESSVYSTAMTNGITMEMCYQLYELHYKKLGVNEMFCFFLQAFRAKDTHKKQQIIDGKNKHLNWFWTYT